MGDEVGLGDGGGGGGVLAGVFSLEVYVIASVCVPVLVLKLHVVSVHACVFYDDAHVLVGASVYELACMYVFECKHAWVYACLSIFLRIIWAHLCEELIHA